MKQITVLFLLAMMLFRTVKSQIVSILGDAAAGRFQVIGWQVQGKDGADVLGQNRLVQVFFSSGSFPAGQRMTGPVDHLADFKIELTAAEEAAGDLAVIQDENSTPDQIASAMAAISTAAQRADESLDELADLVFQILMDGRNYDLGLAKGKAIGRHFEAVRKDDPIQRGEYVVLTATMDFMVRLSEDVTGDVPTAGDKTISTTVDRDGDTAAQMGAESVA